MLKTAVEGIPIYMENLSLDAIEEEVKLKTDGSSRPIVGMLRNLMSGNFKFLRNSLFLPSLRNFLAYLFVIYMEIFSQMITDKVKKKAWKPLKPAGCLPPLLC